MPRQQPTSVTRATQVLTALVVLGGVAAVLTVFLEDELVRSWAEGNASVRRTYRAGGLEAVEASSVQIPAFVPVALVLFATMAGLAWVLDVFFRAGHEWARISLVVLIGFTAIGTVAGIQTGPPTVFVVFSVASLVLEVVYLWFLLHRDTTAYLHGVDAPAPADASR
ncbi:hypothetical protein [Nocardioides dongkuii]|uniref:hypothetical protein n=1 Tax=Nocardioides dongkuii TaxID=2760089 RepID=UPI0015F8199B|nr:hypothetical protein [Nocardioides dongkuii]